MRRKKAREEKKHEEEGKKRSSTTTRKRLERTIIRENAKGDEAWQGREHTPDDQEKSEGEKDMPMVPSVGKEGSK